MLNNPPAIAVQQSFGGDFPPFFVHPILFSKSPSNDRPQSEHTHTKYGHTFPHSKMIPHAEQGELSSFLLRK
jgi:hypothetical protein